MKPFINCLKRKFLIFRNIFQHSNSKIKFLFYSENKNYQKYSYNIIDVLAKKFPHQVLYVSSDIEDKIDKLKVKNLYIGNGLLMRFFFLIIKADYFFLTLTDLNNHALKKTKNIGKYVYYFHAPVSTFKNYTKTAFDNYDIILCNGNYHFEEIRKREEIKNLPKKELLKSGYFYFDYLLEKISSNIEPKDILIAPSWNYDHKHFINEKFVNIIDMLVEKKISTIFRPHPEHFKRSSKILNEIKNKFNENKYFYFDDSNENFDSLQRAKCLITDASGISIEYLLLIKRPVLYLNDKDKIHNKDFLDFKDLKSIDEITKDKFGYQFDDKDIGNLDLIIEKTITNFQTKTPLINNFISDNFFNFGSTKKKFDLLIENQVFK
jgi:YidC/Oxa1 family membrane protein insertase